MAVNKEKWLKAVNENQELRPAAFKLMSTADAVSRALEKTGLTFQQAEDTRHKLSLVIHDAPGVLEAYTVAYNEYQRIEQEIADACMEPDPE